GLGALSKVNPPPLTATPTALTGFLKRLEAAAPKVTLPSEQRRQHQRDALQAEMDRLNATHRPTLSGALDAQGVGNVSPVRPQASASVSLTWPIPWNGMNRDEEKLNALQRNALNIESEQDALRRQGQWWAS